MNTVVSASEGEMTRRLRVEFHAANVRRLHLQRGHGVLTVDGPQFDSRIVGSRCEQLRINLVEVHRPASLVVLLEYSFPRSRLHIVNSDDALVVGRCQQFLEVAVPESLNQKLMDISWKKDLMEILPCDA